MLAMIEKHHNGKKSLIFLFVMLLYLNKGKK